MKPRLDNLTESITALGMEFSDEERICLNFLCICQPSLDPDNYAATEDAVEALALARPKVAPGILGRCRAVLIHSGKS